MSGERDVAAVLAEAEREALANAAIAVNGHFPDELFAAVERIIAAREAAAVQQVVRGRTPDCLPFCQGGLHESTCPAVVEPCAEFGSHARGGHANAVKSLSTPPAGLADDERQAVIDTGRHVYGCCADDCPDHGLPEDAQLILVERILTARLAPLLAERDRLAAAEAAVERVRVVVERLAGGDIDYDTSHGADGEVQLLADLRAALAGDRREVGS